MAQTALEAIVSETKSNKLLSTLDKLSQDDILSVWNSVSAFITRTMQARKGVCITNFGTFTFSQIKMDVGIKSDLVIQRPVFVAAERFLQTLGIQQTKVFVCGEIPVQIINYSSISVETPFSREVVESSVHNVLQTLQKSVSAQRNVEFTFSGLGRLYIRNGRLKMKFFKDFINSLDSSGAVMDLMKNRPSTADSVMSEIATPRPGALSVNTVRLPRSQSDEAALKAIKEEDEGFLSEGGRNSEAIDEETQPVAEAASPDSACEPNHTENAEPDAEKTIAKTQRSGAETMRRSVSSMSCRPLHIVNMEVPELTSRLGGTARPDNVIESTRRPISCIGTGADEKLPAIESRQSCATTRSERRDASVGTTEMLTTTKNDHPVSTRRSETAASSRSDDCRSCSGQELCYVCYQRAKLNVPIYFDEERRRQDRAEDEMLNKYHEMKVAEFQLNKQKQSLAHRHEAQKVAAFNRGAADAQRNHKVSKSADFFPSFIFQQRPKTPAKSVKQDVYNRQLNEQVDLRRKNREKLKADEAFIDELEQQQLAVELAEQRARYLQNKAAAKESYKGALDMQLSTKTETTPPAREPNSSSPIFGKNDARTEDLIAQRKKAIDVAKHQFDTVENRKKYELLQKMQEQKDEMDMLRRNAAETMVERAKRFEEMYESRKALEKEWLRHADEKLHREFEEYRAALKSPGGLVQEQMDKYKRCAQCKRKLHNTGELNVWTDTRYVTGTRYMM